MHPLVALVTVVALMLFAWQGFRVGSARSRYGVEAPATTGHPDFERHFRVQANTLEGLVLFLPSLWLFALGAMFMFVTLFMPRGIMGLVRRRKPTDVTEPNLARAAAREVTG